MIEAHDEVTAENRDIDLITRKSHWKTGREYYPGIGSDEYLDTVLYGTSASWYRCIVHHQSGVFKDDLEAGYWRAISWMENFATDLMLARKILADEIDVESLVVKHLRTDTTGPRVSISGSMIEIWGQEAVNIRSGINAQGEAVLEFLQNDGRVRYNLGPGGITEIPVTQESWTEIRMRYLGTDLQLILSDTNKYKYREIYYSDCETYYQYHSKVVAGVVEDPANNGKLFVTRDKSQIIPLGYYVRGPHNPSTSMMKPWQWKSGATHAILTPDDLPGMSIYNETVIDYDPIYMASLTQYVNGDIGSFTNSRVEAYWNGDWSENPR